MSIFESFRCDINRTSEPKMFFGFFRDLRHFPALGNWNLNLAMQSKNFITELFMERSQKLAGISLVRKAFLELGYEFWEQGTFDLFLDLREIR